MLITETFTYYDLYYINQWFLELYFQQRTTVLFKAGLIEEELATVLHPQEMPSSGPGHKNCLIKANDVTGIASYLILAQPYIYT